MIYYVEDDTNIRDLTVYALKQAGFEAAGFAAAGEFFAACKQRMPELVLLDIMLPEIDGLEILHMLREDAATRNLPVTSAFGSEERRVQQGDGLGAGAGDSLPGQPAGRMGWCRARERALLRITKTAPPWCRRRAVLGRSGRGLGAHRCG